MSDLHIGEGCVSPYNGTENCYSVQNLRAAVEYLNTVVIPKDGISVIFITGDVTSSAELSQYSKVKSILDGLSVPYYPVIGNHDVWPYASTYEAPSPYGDAYFARTFADIFTNQNDPLLTNYNANATYNPQNNCTSWFQNFEITIADEGLVFFGCDFNTRDHALPGYKGALPQADLHNFTGGTFQWVEQRLAANRPAPVKKFFFMHHQPYRCPFPIPDWSFCFADSAKTAMRDLMSQYYPVQQYWGVLAGHLHLWANETAFDQWPTFRQWETSACKGSALNSNITSALTSLFIEDGDVSQINYYWRDLGQAGQWFEVSGT